MEKNKSKRVKKKKNTFHIKVILKYKTHFQYKRYFNIDYPKKKINK